jgi:23S rRNA pseudouridine2605 synthase
MNTEVPQRLQKILAERGIGSRREIEAWIVAGQIFVNGKLAVLGTKATNADQITVQGNLVPPSRANYNATPRVILYHKPVGEICTRSDPQGRNTVFASLPKLQGQRWISVGRLDINSSGLILFTTDGDLANKLMHPKANIEREYAVRVLGTLSNEALRKVTTGVTLSDGTQAKFLSAKFVGGSGANSWYHVTLTQGRYREVRRIWESQGLRVSRLIRIRYGDLKLPRTLPEGKFIDIEYEAVLNMI